MRSLAMFSLVSVALACSNSNEFSESDKRQKAKDLNSGETAVEIDSTGSSSQVEDEDRIEAPVMISGAFLTVACGWSSSSFSSEGRTAACVVIEKDSRKKYPIETKGWGVNWFAEGSSKSDQKVPVEPLLKSHRHHAELHISQPLLATPDWRIGATLISPDGEQERISMLGKSLKPWQRNREESEVVSFSLDLQWKVSNKGIDSDFSAADRLAEIFGGSPEGLCNPSGEFHQEFPKSLRESFGRVWDRLAGAFEETGKNFYALDDELQRQSLELSSHWKRSYCASDLGAVAKSGDFVWDRSVGYYSSFKRCFYVTYMETSDMTTSRIGVFKVPQYMTDLDALQMMKRFTYEAGCETKPVY